MTFRGQSKCCSFYREVAKKCDEIAVQQFQDRQIEMTKELRDREKQQSLLERSKAEMEAKADWNERETRRRLLLEAELEDLKYQRQADTFRDKKRNELAEIDRRELEIAREMSEDFHRRQNEYKREMERRVVTIGKKQSKAKKWLVIGIGHFSLY